MNMNSIRATAVVLSDDRQKVLMIHRLRDGNEYYVLPGGHVEAGESVETAVVRELQEETSICAKLGKRVFEFVDSDKRMHQLYSFDYLSGEPKLMVGSIEKTRISSTNYYEPVWVSIGRIPELTIWPDGTGQFLNKYIADLT